MSYLTIELLIIATGLIIFIVSFCGFLQKWMQYVEDLEETGNDHTSKCNNDIEKGQINLASSVRCILHENCAFNNEQIVNESHPPSYNTIDLPPKYEEAVPNVQYSQTCRNSQILEVQQLPQVHCVHVNEASINTTNNVQHV